MTNATSVEIAALHNRLEIALRRAAHYRARGEQDEETDSLEFAFHYWRVWIGIGGE